MPGECTRLLACSAPRKVNQEKPMTTPRSVRLLLLAVLLLPFQAVYADDHHDHDRDRHDNHHDGDSRVIRILIQQVLQLQQQVAALQTQVNNLSTQTGPLDAIAPYVSLQTNGSIKTVLFSGVNVQVVNGLNSTTTANGMGNLIIGYNEADTTARSLCTVGANGANNPPTPSVDLATCTAAGGQWVTTGFKTGSHYLVVGSQNNYSRWGGIVGGFQNTSNYDYANASGGQLNISSNRYNSVSGGWRNFASGDYSSISGGSLSTSSGHLSSISGGDSNTASGENSSVVAGAGNTASGILSAVTGGNNQTASGDLSSVSGGQHNTASGRASSVSGGGGDDASSGNTASGSYSHVCGGAGKTNSTTDGVTCVNAP
jgi:hypothetical protein